MPSAKEWLSVACPKCATSQNIYVYKIADVRQEPELRPMLFRGELNMFDCVNCKTRLHYDEYMVYSDSDKGLLINLFSKDYLDKRGDICKKIVDDLVKIPPASMAPSYILFGYAALARIIALVEGVPDGKKPSDLAHLEEPDYYRRMFVLSEEYLYAREDESYDEKLPGIQQRFETAFESHKARDHEAARAGYEAILRDMPNYFNANFNLGLIHFNQTADLEKALACFRKCFSLRPNDGEIVFALGQALLKNGQVAEAVEYFRNTVVVMPQYGLGWFNLGLGLSMLGQVKEGLEMLDTSMALAGGEEDKALILRAIQKIRANLPEKK